MILYLYKHSMSNTYLYTHVISMSNMHLYPHAVSDIYSIMDKVSKIECIPVYSVQLDWLIDKCI